MCDLSSLVSVLKDLFNSRSGLHLDIVDDQVDFMCFGGALSVNPPHGKECADEIIQPTSDFLARLPSGRVRDVLVKLDTHIADEYRQSEEGKVFPPHCIWGTKGWELAIDLGDLPARIPTFVMAKNVFDMWGTLTVGVEKDKIVFQQGEENVHEALYKAVLLKAGVSVKDAITSEAARKSPHRDQFMADRHIGPESVVMVAGVASDWCTRYAIEGYLKRGAKVLVLDDLTRGFGGEPSVAPETGSSQEVAQKHLAPYLASGQLQLVPSAAVLQALA